MVNRIMIYTVGSGLLTAGFALASLVTTLALKPSFAASFSILEMLPQRELSIKKIYMPTEHTRLFLQSI